MIIPLSMEWWSFMSAGQVVLQIKIIEGHMIF
jgi:hypothetical protein